MIRKLGNRIFMSKDDYIAILAGHDRLYKALSWLASEIERDHELGRLSVDSEDCAKSARRLLDSAHSEQEKDSE